MSRSTPWFGNTYGEVAQYDGNGQVSGVNSSHADMLEMLGLYHYKCEEIIKLTLAEDPYFFILDLEFNDKPGKEYISEVGIAYGKINDPNNVTVLHWRIGKPKANYQPFLFAHLGGGASERFNSYAAMGSRLESLLLGLKSKSRVILGGHDFSNDFKLLAKLCGWLPEPQDNTLDTLKMWRAYHRQPEGGNLPDRIMGLYGGPFASYNFHNGGNDAYYDYLFLRHMLGLIATSSGLANPTIGMKTPAPVLPAFATPASVPSVSGFGQSITLSVSASSGGNITTATRGGSSVIAAVPSSGFGTPTISATATVTVNPWATYVPPPPATGTMNPWAAYLPPPPATPPRSPTPVVEETSNDDDGDDDDGNDDDGDDENGDDDDGDEDGGEDGLAADAEGLRLPRKRKAGELEDSSVSNEVYRVMANVHKKVEEMAWKEEGLSWHESMERIADAYC